MSSRLTIPEILASLEAQLAQHRGQAELHAAQEAHHRERREHHEREAEAVTRSLEALRTGAGLALERVGREAVSVPEDDGFASDRERILSGLVRKVIAAIPEGERFGPGRVAAEVDRRFPGVLRKAAALRQVSDVLRRLGRTGELRQVRSGRPHHEALYVREPRG